MKGKDGILADEDSDGRLQSVVENTEYYRMQSRKQPIRWLDCHKIFMLSYRLGQTVFYPSLQLTYIFSVFKSCPSFFALVFPDLDACS